MLRIKVIEMILRFFLIFCYKDLINYLIVFYYCFWFSNDDEVCVKYLNIFLREKDVKRLLSKDDMNCNMVFYIVVMEIKCSRIMSILEFFESNVDIVDILNGDEFLLLYFVIRLFERENKLYRIECCIKVILIIFYSVSFKKLLIMSDIVIEECEYECVKSIFRNLEDCENMKKNLDIFFEELKWNEGSEIFEVLYILFREFDFGL